MTPLEFLTLILPEQGIHYLAIFKDGYSAPAHKSYDSLDKMAQAIEGMAASEQLAVYHACASYKEHFIEAEEDGEAKRKYRIPPNWDRAKAFWLDIDCGQDKAAKGKGYIDKPTAAKAVFGFADRVGWPRPMLVDSGNGLHAYWPLVKAIRSDAWCKVADLLKTTLAHDGVLADPTRTADFASILRPVGSINRKGEPKPVKVRSQCAPCEPKFLLDSLASYMKANRVGAPRHAAAGGLNMELVGLLDIAYPQVDSSGQEVANKCAQVAAMRDSGGNVEYEHWRGVLGVLKHCVDGAQLAQQWSSGHPDYSAAATEQKMDSWSKGPATCEFFAACNPSGCQGCEHQGKIKSPIVLGRVMPEPTEIIEDAVDEAGEELQVQVPPLPTGYQWDGALLSRVLPDKDGVLHSLPFCAQLFYPTMRIRTTDGTYRIGMRMHLPTKRVRDFEMPYESMASQTDMLRGLARYELMQTNHKDAGGHMAAYLRDQLEALKRRVEEVNTMTTFGWKDDGSFLLGDRLYMPDGTVRQVLLGGSALGMAKYMMPPAGASVAGYADALNYMYSRPNMQHAQYAICALWGSLLSPLSSEMLYRGLTLALSGGKSGKGKTTLCYAGLYAFGNADQLTAKQDRGFTPNALWSVMGTYNNIPLLLDELTNMEPKAFSEFTYGVTTGKEKIRMQSRGGSVSLTEPNTWCMAPVVTGNFDFHGLLAAHNANSEAEAVRLIQIRVGEEGIQPPIEPPIPLQDMTPAQLKTYNTDAARVVQGCLDRIMANAGVAGRAFVQYIVTNREQVRALISDTAGQLLSALPETRHRYYRAHASCTLAAAHIAKELGIIEFDLDELYEYTVSLLTDLAETVTDTNTIEEGDIFNRMLNSLLPRILVTVEYRDKRSKDGPETPRNRVHGEVCGRYVLGSATRKDFAGQLMLAHKDVREWCMANRVDFDGLLGELDDAGALLRRHERVTLTRGTDMPTVQARCIVIDLHKLHNDSLTLVQTPAPVVNAIAAGV